MKTRHFIILGSFIALFGLIYIPILSKDQVDAEDSKVATPNYIAVAPVLNQALTSTLTAYGQILPNQQLDVTMQVQGFLERDQRSLRPGMAFKKNDMLYKVERVDALYNIIARRSAFTNLITSALPDLKVDYPSAYPKWEKFLTEIDAVKALPPLPSINDKREKLFINSRNIPSEYYSIKASETQLDNYFYLAPFDGTVIASYTEPGAMVTPGMRLATIARTTNYEIKAPIPTRQLSLFQQSDMITFKNPDGQKIGIGKFLRFSEAINQQTQSVDAYFSFQALPNTTILQGMFVNLESNTEIQNKSVLIPENAVRNNMVQVLKDSLIHQQIVEVISRKTDSVFVRGLHDGSLLILEPVNSIDGAKKYIGIEK
jgi:membrane fusion protein, multidrug efflux system